MVFQRLPFIILRVGDDDVIGMMVGIIGDDVMVMMMMMMIPCGMKNNEH